MKVLIKIFIFEIIDCIEKYILFTISTFGFLGVLLVESGILHDPILKNADMYINVCIYTSLSGVLVTLTMEFIKILNFHKIMDSILWNILCSLKKIIFVVVYIYCSFFTFIGFQYACNSINKPLIFQRIFGIALFLLTVYKLLIVLCSFFSEKNTLGIQNNITLKGKEKNESKENKS